MLTMGSPDSCLMHRGVYSATGVYILLLLLFLLPLPVLVTTSGISLK